MTVWNKAEREAATHLAAANQLLPPYAITCRLDSVTVSRPFTLLHHFTSHLFFRESYQRGIYHSINLSAPTFTNFRQ